MSNVESTALLLMDTHAEKCMQKDSGIYAFCSVNIFVLYKENLALKR
jgi:hypothetical protein